MAALGTLGDPTRRAIFECLARQPMAVGQLSAELPVTRPAVSQHLKVLKQAGLVTDHADGTRRIYQINPEGVQAIYSYLDQMCGPHPGYAVVTGCAREHADHEHR